MNAPARTFVDSPAIREQVPLLIGLMGPSGGGKTFSALRLARGIQTVSGGEIYVIDTEARRALHYAEQFTFRHLPFNAPFGSLDYLAAIQHCVSKGAGVIVVDSMSHEHEGPGGLLDMHEQELDRMAGNDWSKRERVKMLAWQKPKAARRALINGLLQINANFIFCFRAKETAKPIKVNGKTEVVPHGFMPIAGDEFVFEMTANCLLLPNAGGVPTWQSENIGERMMMKLPGQFRSIFGDGQPLSEDIGHALAQWARGNGAAVDRTALHIAARGAARKGVDALQAHWRGLSKADRAVVNEIMAELKETARLSDEAVDDFPADEAPANGPAVAPKGAKGATPPASPKAAGEAQPPVSPAADTAAEDLFPGDLPSGVSSARYAELIETGRKAFAEGLTRRAAVPPDLRDDPDLPGIVQAGYDAANAEAGEEE